MKAAKLHPGKFEIIDTPKPNIKDKDVLVRIKYCGVCGSDLNIYKKDPPIPKYWPGHEISGVIEAVNSDSSFKKGQNVTIKPLINCGECDQCKKHFDNFCSNYSFIGINYPGGFAEYINVPEKVVFRLNNSQPLEIGTLLEPLSCAYHALKRFTLKESDDILIFGAGVQGLLSLLLLKKHFKIKNVDIICKYAHQQKKAQDFGANHTYLHADKKPEKTYDVIIETVGGNGESLQNSIILSKPMGEIALLGTCYANPNINTKLITEKQLVISGSHRYTTDDYKKALDISTEMTNSLLSLITHRFELDKIEDAFSIAFKKENERVIKVLIFNK